MEIFLKYAAVISTRGHSQTVQGDTEEKLELQKTLLFHKGYQYDLHKNVINAKSVNQFSRDNTLGEKN